MASLAISLIKVLGNFMLYRFSNVYPIAYRIWQNNRASISRLLNGKMTNSNFILWHSNIHQMIKNNAIIIPVDVAVGMIAHGHCVFVGFLFVCFCLCQSVGMCIWWTSSLGSMESYTF